MTAAVPEPPPPPDPDIGAGAERGRRLAVLPPSRSDAPVTRSARKNGFMSQQNAQAQAQPSPTAGEGEPSGRANMQNQQPSVGSIAAHRPHAVAAAVSDLDPDLDADLDVDEEAEGARLPQGRFLDRARSWLPVTARV
ncbi:MAG: hypothetical protein LBV60_17125, partial [Streptomyces sp.]|nr:hypothetical protein [Streptomyces sp.]